MFLKRVELKGDEAYAYVEIIKELNKPTSQEANN